MSYQAIKEYLVAILSRYQSGSRQAKTALLNEAVQVTGYTRKHLIRQLKKPAEMLKRKKPSGRHYKYPKELLISHIKRLWIAMERISGRRMKAAYPDWLPFYKHEEFTPQVRRLLEEMSVATLDRFLRMLRGEMRANKGISTTPDFPASRFMKNKVPINTLDYKVERPGFTQSDTVAHCGTSSLGPFVNSLTLTDIDSTWTENRAMFAKKATTVRHQLVDIKHSLPFELLAINVDSGSEFINNAILQFVDPLPGSGQKKIELTRSRPYKKNDNCYVEQKNFTHVRELFGYERIDEPRLVALMNDIYKTCWNPLQNFFLPTFKLKEKIRVGARIIKKFDRPQTPFDRLMKSPHLSEEQKERLKQMKAPLNPFELKRLLEDKLKNFFEELRRSKNRELA